jgi:Arc/MetJ family transcription regulator
MEMQGKYAVYAERARVARALKAIDSAFGPRALRALALSMPRAADSVDFKMLREAEGEAERLRGLLAGLNPREEAGGG